MTLRMKFLLIFLPVFAATALAADFTGGERKNLPIQIKSTALSTDSAKGIAVFTGKVQARQGDVVIYCDRMIIYYSDTDKDVERIEAFGNVRIIQGNRTAVSGHGIYENKAGKIILDDNPKLYQGEDEVTGKVITYYIESKRSEVTSNPGAPVVVTIHPKQKGSDDSVRP